ncbi:hypothetical protein Fmac_028744 [Flemingia macrophylla]|uniref:Uncharacterized protein n=1 Tax=Flemingia macrophylla TaxID=520843 RepID=A0ABD1L9U6_9FABA
MTTILVFVLLRSNLQWMSILRLMLQTPIADHHGYKDKALDREDGFQLLAFGARNDAIVIRGVHNVATNTFAETIKLKGKLYALVNLVTQLVSNQKPASIARVRDIRSSNNHHTSVCPSSQQFEVDEHPEAYVANTYSRPPQQGIHDVATDTSAETRKLEGKLDALVNLVTQLAANQKPASVARVCDILSSNDHHTSVCASSQQSAGDENPEAYAANTYSRPPPQLGVHDVARDTSAETRKLEGKPDALVNLETQLAANQKPASVARLCDILSSNDHHTSVCPSSQQYEVDENPEAYAANTYSRPPQLGVQDVATDTSAETRKLEGKLDAFVNLVTQLAANRSLPRYKSLRHPFCNDHHTSVYPSLQSNLQWMSIPRLMPANTYSKPPQLGVHDVATDTSFETRKLKGKLDALVNLVSQVAANQKPASVAKVCSIRSCNDHHTSQFSARNDAIVFRGVHDVATDTSAETRTLEGKLDALVNLVTQLAMNQQPATVARVYGICSTNDHHTSVCPSS